MSLSMRLKALREEKKESLQDVANDVEASKTHIWELERGTTKNPSIDLIKKLATHFQVTIDHLTSGEDNNSYLAFARELEEKKLEEEDLEFLRNAVKMLEGKKRGS